eukprot:9424075-Pyramimonas_sp.AAC.2
MNLQRVDPDRLEVQLLQRDAPERLLPFLPWGVEGGRGKITSEKDGGKGEGDSAHVLTAT